MNRMLKSAAAAIVAASVLTAGVVTTSHYARAADAAATAAKATVGAAAPGFTLQDQDGKAVTLGDYTGKVVVLEWTNPECPFVKRHYEAKTMVDLAKKYEPQGVVWLAINSTHDNTNAIDKAWHTKEDLAYPVLNDGTGAVGHAYGAKTTPDMYVIGKDGKLLYSGGIDNDPHGDKAAADKVNYVSKALDEVLADKPVTTAETKSYGCGVHYAE